MARIIQSDGTELSHLPHLQDRLGALGIALRHWPLPADARIQALLAKAALNGDESEAVLQAVDHRFQLLCREAGYTTRDLIVVHEGILGLGELMSKFAQIHYHTDDEVRYVLAGSGYFGFVDRGGEQFLLEVSAGDYINVPARTEHWFILGHSSRIKAVRYFIDSSGWTPVYTNRSMHPALAIA
jgi:1,2-dihydroxy-3-keto-5-methylthiopentene dioxygenase